ncbi:hypothetical protein [Actinomadura flavalba]|uniref:hypothetical protein n=1 Tax=Actinomadura flavalba TaxID=1120938 RepID=UPI000381DF39|nr:hypothetical protein [Actinomadura flavalba]
MTVESIDAAARLAAAGESSLVLCAGDGTPAAARAMLPRLPEVCFVHAGPADLAPAARAAAAHGLRQFVVVGRFAELAEAAGGDAALADITAAMGGDAAGTADYYAFWEETGLLGTCGRELCRRVTDGLDAPVAAQVVLVGGADGRMVGMYGRLAPAR